MSNATAWDILGDRKRRCSIVLRHATSISNQALSLERGAITSQMGGRSVVMVKLHIERRLRRLFPYLSLTQTVELAEGGAAVDGGGRGRKCTRVCIGTGGGGGG